MITSTQNARVKFIAALHERKTRAAHGVCWAESRRCVEMALASAWPVREVALSATAGGAARELARRAAAHGIPVQEYSEACFRKMSALRHSDGIGAVVATRLARGTPPDAAHRTLVAWHVQDPGNLGSIIRTAAAMHCRRIVTVEPCVDAAHPLCVRATAGMVFLTEIWQADETTARAWLATHAPVCAALSTHGAEPLQAAAAQPPQILIAGNEARGVPEDLARAVRCIAIPMAPGVESLNVNAAAAIALYVLWCAQHGSRAAHT